MEGVDGKRPFVNIDSETWRQTVIAGARSVGLDLSVNQARRMGKHAMELLQWNRVNNLTTITDPLNVAIKHYVDSLAAVAWIGDNTRVLDAGSGGGFPGIPLKIVRPDLSITMVDRVRKKVSFLKHAIRVLGLGDIDAVHGRLEDLGGLPQYREQFDVVVCRAFSSLGDFATLTAPFLTPGGSLLAMRGRDADLNHQAVSWSDEGLLCLGGSIFEMKNHHYRLPILDAKRRMVLLKRLPEDCGRRSEGSDPNFYNKNA
jgi:16S rRNA (guanine527-N7)-methyltransferase